ncbi:cation transporter [Sneathiella marina]|uniref:Cation transporter n=2 Tax=Sneathiella marina TaxID=2950108 RepID=A0ABY4WF23_9PROT|nr:cation transporter [Sneathiella marina]
MLSAQVTVALSTGTLTMLAEAVRGSLMLIVEIFSLAILHAVHRNKLQHFQFGIGKIEQFIWLLIGVALLISGLWLGQVGISRLLEEPIAPSPLALAISATINAINLLINGFAWYAMLSTRKGDDSDIFRAQFRTRTVKTLSSIFLQITLTIAALTNDSLIALIMDTTGAGVVSLYMIISGFSMAAHSFPHLLDSPVSTRRHNKISSITQKALGNTFDISKIRTRQSGRYDHVEITIMVSDQLTGEQIKKQFSGVKSAIEKEIENIDLCIAITTENLSSQKP